MSQQEPFKHLDRQQIWPLLAATWLLRETKNWIAVDKPTEVPCPVGAEREFGLPRQVLADLLSRLRRGLPSMQDLPHEGPMTALFDPLDGDLRAQPNAAAQVSGVCFVARRPEIVEQYVALERSGQIRLTAVLGVYHWPGELEIGLRDLRQRMLEMEQIHVVSAHTLRGRTLLTLSYVSGKCLDLVVELKKLGVVVATVRLPDQVDLTQNTPPAPRLLLHRSQIASPNWLLEAPIPPAFSRWQRDAEAEPLDERLESALRRRFVLGHQTDTNALRLLDSVHDDLALDCYAEHLVLNQMVDFSAQPSPAELAKATASAKQLAEFFATRFAAKSVYLKLRPRQANVVVDAVAAGLVPMRPIWGQGPTDGVLDICEAGLAYRVRLGAGLACGIYLDQRDNRRWLVNHTVGLRVLNTFAYTCAFSVAAAAGGALRTVSIDASAPALEDGRYNLERNGFLDATQHDLIRGDVFHWLPRMARRGDTFDLIVLDPPSYSKVKHRRFSANTDYPELVATALALLAPGGTLLACINHAQTDRRRLHQMVLSGAALAGRSLISIQHQPGGVDFPAARMKSLVARFS